jgi:hypothetical protein
MEAFFALELRADFFSKLLDALVGVGDVRFQSGRTVLLTLDGHFEGADCAKCRVPNPRAATVAAARNHFGGIVKTGTHE